jgi:DNA-binding SARP family transcriptional activator
LVVSALCQAAWDDNLRRGAWLGRLARRFRLDPDWQWAMLAYSCMIHYRLGELDLAGRLIDEGLALPEVQNNDVWRGMGIILKHVVLYSQDDEAAAQPLRDQLWDLGERYDSPYYKAYAMRTFAFPHVHQGRRELAAENLRASLYFFDRAGNEGMTLITRLDLANLAASAGRDGASAALPEARAALQQLMLTSPGQGLVDQGQSLFGAVACAAGAYEEAEEQLLASAAASRRKGAKQILAGTCLHLANLYAEQRRAQDADRYLEEALSLAEQGGYRVFWDWSRPVIQAMLTRAGERRIHADYALQLQRHWFADLATATARTEVAAAATPRLSIRLLGDFSVSVGGQEIATGAWQTRKVKSLLKILALDRGRRVRREQLAEQLWPGAEPESSAASLRVTLTRLRRALASVADGGGAAALQAGTGFVALRSDLVAPTDAERFVSDVEQGLALCERGDAAAATALLTPALAAYGGGLLPEDLYEEYATIERERLQLLYHDALLALAAIRRDDGNRDDQLAARDLLRRALALDPLHEDTVHALVQTHLALEQRAEATAVYRRYRQRLQAEYGTEPGHRLTELVASDDNH